jgi:hypothetical protein
MLNLLALARLAKKKKKPNQVYEGTRMANLVPQALLAIVLYDQNGVEQATEAVSLLPEELRWLSAGLSVDIDNFAAEANVTLGNNWYIKVWSVVEQWRTPGRPTFMPMNCW